MDLRGYGETNREAVKELIDLINAQISFAIKKKDMSLIWFPAEKKYFNLYEKLKEQYLKSLNESRNYTFRDLPFKIPVGIMKEETSHFSHA